MRTLESRLIIPIIVLVLVFFVFVFSDIYFVNHTLHLHRTLAFSDKIPWHIDKTSFYHNQYVMSGTRSSLDLLDNSLNELKSSFDRLASKDETSKLKNIATESIRIIDFYKAEAISEKKIVKNEHSEHSVKLYKEFIGKMESSVMQCKSELNQRIRYYRKWLYVDLSASFFMAIIIMIMMLLTIRSRLSRPIQQLIRTIERISKGSIEDRVPIPDTYELARLASSFNEMADAVYKSRTDLMVQRDRLEAVVEKRTEELSKLNEKLLRSNKELDDFTYTVSHDLKEPLRAVSVFSGFLKEECYDKISADGQESIDIIQHSTGRMKKLIEDLLELSRITRSRNPLTVVSMRKILEEIIQEFSLVIKENNAKVLLPENDVKVECDVIRIKQLLGNLISNGLKFNRSDDRVVCVQMDQGVPHDAPVKPVKPLKYVTIAIEDNGIGIAPEYHETVFEIFQRLVSREEFDGTGAGLAICRKIVEDHNGKIWIRSTPDQGSTFFIMLPIKATQRDET